MLTLITSAAVVNTRQTFIMLKYSQSMHLPTEKLRSQISVKLYEMQDVRANVSLSLSPALQILNVIDGTVEMSIHLIMPLSAFLCCC